MDRKDIFSSDRKYRYVLWREWDSMFSKSYVMFIGLNPSTADEIKSDPTLTRCIGFAKRWGYGALCMTNLFAYRSTDPRVLLQQDDPVGPQNDELLVKCAKEAGAIIAAWGTFGGLLNRQDKIEKLISGMKCLRLTKDGFPEHPLYVPYSVSTIDYPCTGVAIGRGL